MPYHSKPFAKLRVNAAKNLAVISQIRFFALLRMTLLNARRLLNAWQIEAPGQPLLNP